MQQIKEDLEYRGLRESNVCIVGLMGCRLCGGKGSGMYGRDLGGGRQKSAKSAKEMRTVTVFRTV